MCVPASRIEARPFGIRRSGMPRPGPQCGSMSGRDRSFEQSYAAAVCRAAQKIDHGIGARSCRQGDIERRLVVQHRVWPIEETTLTFASSRNTSRPKANTLATRAGRSLSAGAQKLLLLAPAFERRLGHDLIGEAADIVRADAVREFVQRRDRQALLDGIGQRQRRLGILRFDAEKFGGGCRGSGSP